MKSATKSLVIVESPAKAKTINRYLGDSYVVASSIGHVRNLPNGSTRRPGSGRTKGTKRSAKQDPNKKLYERMGIDPTRDWKANYVISEDKAKVVKQLSRLARQSDTVYLATDMDREGEAIAWHLAQVLAPPGKKANGENGSVDFKRVMFNEITRDAIQKAFEEPGEINYDRVNAQQARRFLDRVVGFMLSPLLWEKVARNLSAGRVQSVATRLVVEREALINAFVPEEYWELRAHTRTEKQESLCLQIKKYAGTNFRPNSADDVEKAVVDLEKLAPYTIGKRTNRAGTTRPSPPFITSTLQQAASVRLGYGVKKTMFLAQRLYEAGHISYMRTDSTALSDESVAACRAHIQDKYGVKYLPEKPNIYASGRGAQEAHEAIRPTRVDVGSERIRIPKAERDAARLYELIWRQFVACQMPAMRYNTTSMTVTAGDYEMRASGRVLVFDGFTKVLQPVQKKSEQDKDVNASLPDIDEGHVLSLDRLEKTQRFTRPKARYSEATLVKEMEKLGIGRPSTYASVIATIQERGYVSLRNKRLYAEKIGEIVTGRLVENFRELMDYSFTASLEESLDKIACGEAQWKEVLDGFYKDFREQLEKARTSMRPNDPFEIDDVRCPDCDRVMCLRTGSTGMFLGCSGYAQGTTERCKRTINLVSLAAAEMEMSDGETEDDAHASRERIRLLESERCEQCNSVMQPYLIDKERCLHVCSNSPDCHAYRLERGDFPIADYKGPDLPCDRCSATMELKSGRYGKYFDCTNESCNNTRKLLPSGEPAPPKMIPVPMPELRCQRVDDYYLLRDGMSGLFLAASQFPRHRETRSPRVAELVAHKDAIDPKYHYLLSAPLEDPDGNPTEIRFSRKSREQYLLSISGGKPTGWQAYYRNNTWQEQRAAPKRASAKKKKT